MTENGGCVPCPEGASCNSVGNELATLTIEPGNFRAAILSYEVYPCKLKEACPGGNRTGDDSCSDGYEGPLCG